jgi:TIR domain-containing protein/WD40 domain-containing protein
LSQDEAAPHALVRAWRKVTDPVLRFFIGRDVFISYARKDAVRYAPALLRELRKRGVSAFLDQTEASSSNDLPPEIRRALRLCSALAIVVGEHTGDSTYVAQEVTSFITKPRPIVPILIDFAAYPKWLPKAVWESETKVSVDAGTPDAKVVNRLADIAGVFTQARRLRLAITVAVLLLTGAAVAVEVARRRVDSATEETARRAAAAIQALRAQRRAVSEADAAKAARDAANTEATAARTARELATAEALRQGEIASAIAETNEAETILQREPAGIVRAAMLAANAMRKLERLNVHASAADGAVRNAYRLLPRIERLIDLRAAGDQLIDVSPDGRWIAVERDSAIEIFDTQNGASHAWPVDGVPKRSMFTLTISADASTVAALLIDKTRVLTRVWTIDGQFLAEIPQTSDESTAMEADIALNSDGRLVATHVEHVIQVWDTATGKAYPQQLNEGMHVTLAFSPAARYLALGGSRVRIWDWRNNTDFSLDGVSFLGDAQARVAFTPDETFIGFAADEKVGLYGLEKPFDGLRWQVRGMTSPKIAFTPDGKQMVAVDPNRGAVYRTIDGENIGSIPHGGLAFALSGDNRQLAIDAGDGMARLYGLEGRELARAVHAQPIMKLAFAGNRVVSASLDAAKVWRADGPNDPAWSTLSWWMARMAVSSDGTSIVGFGYPSDSGLPSRKPTNLILFDAKSGSVKSSTPITELFGMTFAGPRSLITSDRRKRLQVWTVDGMRLAETQPLVALPAGEWIAATTDGDVLAISNERDVVVRSGWRNGAVRDVTLKHDQRIRALAFDAKSGHLVVGTMSGGVSVWDWRRDTRTPMRRFAHGEGLTGVVAHDDVIVTFGGETKVWDVRRADDKPLAVLRTGAKATSAFVSPDGQALMVASDDRQLRAYSDWTTTRPLEQSRIWLGEPGGAQQLAFAANGQFLISQHRRGLQARLWRSKDLLAATCERLRGSVDEKERARVCAAGD